MTFGNTKVVIAPTDKSLVGLTTDGKEVWKIPYEQGHGTTATPLVDGQTLIVSGPGSGVTAIGLKMEDGQLKEEELWKNTDNTGRFNTPVLKDGLLYGLSNSNAIFCINTDTHETLWSQALGGAEPPAGGPLGPGGAVGGRVDPADRATVRGDERPADRADAAPRLTGSVRFVSTTGLLAQATEQPAAAGQGGARRSRKATISAAAVRCAATASGAGPAVPGDVDAAEVAVVAVAVTARSSTRGRCSWRSRRQWNWWSSSRVRRSSKNSRGTRWPNRRRTPIRCSPGSGSSRRMRTTWRCGRSTEACHAALPNDC